MSRDHVEQGAEVVEELGCEMMETRYVMLNVGILVLRKVHAGTETSWAHRTPSFPRNSKNNKIIIKLRRQAVGAGR